MRSRDPLLRGRSVGRVWLAPVEDRQGGRRSALPFPAPGVGILPEELSYPLEARLRTVGGPAELQPRELCQTAHSGAILEALLPLQHQDAPEERLRIVARGHAV